jgi:hypothetical protein
MSQIPTIYKIVRIRIFDFQIGIQSSFRCVKKRHTDAFLLNIIESDIFRKLSKNII